MIFLFYIQIRMQLPKTPGTAPLSSVNAKEFVVYQVLYYFSFSHDKQHSNRTTNSISQVDNVFIESTHFPFFPLSLLRLSILSLSLYRCFHIIFVPSYPPSFCYFLFYTCVPHCFTFYHYYRVREWAHTWRSEGAHRLPTYLMGSGMHSRTCLVWKGPYSDLKLNWTAPAPGPGWAGARSSQQVLAWSVTPT